MRHIRHKRMVNGDAGIKNGIFIPGGEKIWWSNWIREKWKKDPYNITKKSSLKSMKSVPDCPARLNHIAEMTYSVEIYVSKFHTANPVIKLLLSAGGNRSYRKIKDNTIHMRKDQHDNGIATLLHL
ncbi:hypothetical protein Tco_1407147 [Tanacetum coccineum]